MYTTDQYESMIAETISLISDGGTAINAYIARPLGEGPFPAVVLIHHIPGWDEWNREATRRFAQHGYIAICPNLYFRYGHGTPEDVAAQVRADGGVADAVVMGDVQAATNYVNNLPNSTGKTAVFGTCSGGRHVMLAAAQVEGLSAAIDCWGGRVIMANDDLNEKMPIAPISLTADVTCPILGLFGNDDQSPPAEQVDIHEAALKTAGKEYEFHRYDGAGHGFMYYHAPMYRQAAAVDGWIKIWDFLESHLG
jgi:carboxymethylenebutenolidase